ncbi:ABC transporter permease [Cobetia amphilecti]|uniref:ABC transporter permease n=1 Tax=Cobetia amphilecti TaxID=1055104 RepID=A0ABT6UMU1_9GAMM|nr:FtsX-like permease family protein [Cobetia amphilecti]MDI5884015.1 ABC transporter permease [Cobetia amphilecti]WOI25336.1 ABC transporter permease [Cobetia amphilecti]
MSESRVSDRAATSSANTQRPRAARLPLALRGLLRDLRASDVRALFLALMLAVAATTMIGFFLDRLDRGLNRQASQLLGGDLVLESSNPLDPRFAEAFRAAGLEMSPQLGMVSMASHGDSFVLSSLKAVSPGYPLAGGVELESDATGEEAQAPDTSSRAEIPPPGEAWIVPRLAMALSAEVGDTLTVGRKQLTISGLITREPDQQGGFSEFSPRLMFNMQDLDATGLIQPGSRMEYRLLAAGDPAAVQQARDAIAPLLASADNAEVRLKDVREDRPRLGRSLERADKYLSLAGLVAVLLAGVAVAMSTRRYVERHLDSAALWRCFGASQRQLSRLFAAQLGWLALLASTGGAVLGLLGQMGLVALLERFLPLELPAPGPLPLALGILTALAVLVGFAGPMLLRLRQVSALKVLRRELAPLPASAWVVVAIASLVFGALMWLYSGDLMLAAGLLVGGIIALGLLMVVGQLLLSLMLKVVARMRGQGGWSRPIRLAGGMLARRRGASLGQLVAFAVTFAAMALIALVRGDLITRWQAQIPTNAPNHFAINIQPGEQQAFGEQLTAMVDEQAGDSQSELYPMVRGRITALKGESLLGRTQQRLQTAQSDQPAAGGMQEGRSDEGDGEQQGVPQRELNLTWHRDLPGHNRLSAGEWAPISDFADADSEARSRLAAAQGVPVSMEEELAERMGLVIGDSLSFTIGSETVKAQVVNLRHVDWDSFLPNFYVIFPPGALEGFAHSYMTAFHLEDERKLAPLVRDYPSVSLINIDAILTRVQELIAQVSRAVELILGLVLLAGASVLYAALVASRPAREHEGALYKVFGAGQGLLARLQAAEFVLLGLLSGLLAAMLAEGAAVGLYSGWLGLPVVLHPWLWVLLPLAGGVLIGGLGFWLSREVRRQPPMAGLRALQ